jgi:S1-C subfamily serine protease
MKRAAVYSSSSRAQAAAKAAAPAPVRRLTWREWRALHSRKFRVAGVVAALALLAMVLVSLWPAAGITHEQLEAAIQRALEERGAPATAADAYDAILPSVVHVRGLPDAPDADVASERDTQTGTGVVIVDTGIILTNLHVVHGSKAIKVIFRDGLEADAVIIGAQPENDLAVLQAKTIPDDLVSAPMASTAGLRPGDPVVAVGFPFGIGPSASAGVVSGLGREYQTADGKRVLSNLIQFDAAVNPGNSGGPLVNADGELLGIVTGLLNPTEHRVFIGIGFAVPIENAAGAVGLSPF